MHVHTHTPLSSSLHFQTLIFYFKPEKLPSPWSSPRDFQELLTITRRPAQSTKLVDSGSDDPPRLTEGPWLLWYGSFQLHFCKSFCSPTLLPPYPRLNLVLIPDFLLLPHSRHHWISPLNRSGFYPSLSTLPLCFRSLSSLPWTIAITS